MKLSLYANDLILFAHIVHAGSFTSAARETGRPKATLSRRLSQLEHALGERLLHRSTRQLVLTEFGEQMLLHAKRLSDESREATDFVQHRQVSPQGTLRVSLPPDYRELAIPKVISQFSRQYPKVTLEMDLSPRRVDIIAERFDIAIRAATTLPDDATLVARRITTLYNGLYASPSYLAANPCPLTPSDLYHHTGLVLIASTGEHTPWQLTRSSQTWQGLPNHCLAANSLQLQQALAIQGLGIVGLSGQYTQDDIQSQRLKRILPDWQLPATTLWAVTPGRRLLPQRTVAFIETLKAVLGRSAPS